ncbi:MAG: cation diffusion facilitator family transporter [Methanomassiliicoccales archaeon]|nr:cation diffusion facilitator family transporter [Methanomassiliicoccales archaeon]
MHEHEGHVHHEPRGLSRPLFLALAITVTFALVELAGGVLSGSLALISDSGHMFTDALALALSLWASYVATRMANERQTFGLLRVEILVALVNGVVLVGVSLFIIYEAVVRLQSPQPIEGGLMLAIAVIGLFANLAGVLILRDKAQENLNVKGAFLHVLGDLLSSVGVIVAAILVYLFDLQQADPVISIAISVIILYGSYRIISQSVYILLEFAPGNVDLAEVRNELLKVEGVVDVHDLHAWTLASGIFALSAHIQVMDQPLSTCSCVIQDCEKILREKFNISHTTLQLESQACDVEACFFRQPNGDEGRK